MQYHIDDVVYVAPAGQSDESVLEDYDIVMYTPGARVPDQFAFYTGGGIIATNFWETIVVHFAKGVTHKRAEELMTSVLAAVSNDDLA